MARSICRQKRLRLILWSGQESDEMPDKHKYMSGASKDRDQGVSADGGVETVDPYIDLALQCMTWRFAVESK